MPSPGQTIPPLTNIVNAIYSRLSTTSIGTTMGGRIYLSQADADVAFPLMVYDIAGVDISYFMGGQARLTAEVEFRLHFSNKGELLQFTATDQLSKALENEMTASGFDRVKMWRVGAGVPSFEDDSWSITERYRMVAHTL